MFEITQPAESSAQNGKQVRYPFNKMSIWFEDFELRKPTRTGTSFTANNDKLMPYECRLRSLTYSAPLMATIARKFDNKPEER